MLQRAAPSTTARWTPNAEAGARARRLLGMAAVLSLAVAGTVRDAAAQATGLPTFSAPTRWFGTSEAGVTLSRPGGGGTALEGRYGAALDRSDLSFRAGFADPGAGGDASFVAGVEARVPVLGRSQTFPLDGGLILGLGRNFVSGAGENFVPVGLSLGRRFVLDGPALQLAAYAQPTIVFRSTSDFVFGLGVDLRVRGLPDVRLNWALGDMDGFSLSAFWSR